MVFIMDRLLFLTNLTWSDCKRRRGYWTKKAEEAGADAWLANGQTCFIWGFWGYIRSMYGVCKTLSKTRLLAF